MNLLKKERQNFILLITLTVLTSTIFVSCVHLSASTDAYEASDENRNDSFEDAISISEGWYRELAIENNDNDYFKVAIKEDFNLIVSVYYSNADGNLTLFLYDDQQNTLNSSADSSLNYQLSSSEFRDEKRDENDYAYVKVNSSDGIGVPYQLFVNYVTVGDSSGFYISDDYLNEGYRPNTLMLVLGYIMMGSTVLLWIQFGFSFIFKGRKDKAANEAQARYYKGLGVFILSVAISESTYLLDLFSRDVAGSRFFNKYNTQDTFYSFIEADYYAVSFVLVLLGLTVLLYPMEAYLYAKKKKVFTLTVGICVPGPIVLRILELNHDKIGLDLSSTNTFDYQLLAAMWIMFLIIGLMGMLYLIKLYLDLGRKAPRGSQLRKKSRQIILGIFLWLGAIFSTSELFKNISSVTSSWGPYSQAKAGFVGWFVGLKLYYFMPFVIPLLLFLALRLLVSGFTRDYA